jgi:ribosomal protein S12 methylthiotransferase accessory factor YcaO
MAKKQRRKSAQRPPPKAKAKGTTGRGAGTKQAKLIALLERAEGATITEIVKVTGWLPHTVRGAISGALKKRLGLTVISVKEERGRVYHIGKVRSAA